MNKCIIVGACKESLRDFTYDKDDFIVTCKVVENNRTIFEVSTSSASRDQAKFISDNWKENAINIYPKMMDLLTNPNHE